ncbi:hypothetical protein BJ165DRAFT_929933 [Panaeolus papilionaceus]|nr:hypothetical protein BJ165DRAFT_929933 [Panaeolus papilionaceus]
MDTSSEQQNHPAAVVETEPCPVSGCNLPVDIILVSSDGTAISTHKANLGQFSNGFPPHAGSGGPDLPMEIGQGLIEEVKLEEKGEVLRLLLRFMHHAHLPDLDVFPFKLVAQFAEAAEKYEVFSAVAASKKFMKTWAKDRWCPRETAILILFYALKHGYAQIANEAANHTRSFSVDAFLARAQEAGVQHRHIIQWIRYRELFVKQVQRIWEWCDLTNNDYELHDFQGARSDQWKKLEYIVIPHLTSHPEYIASFRRAVADIVDFDVHNSMPEHFILACNKCRERRDDWAYFVETEVIHEYPFLNLPALER